MTMPHTAIQQAELLQELLNRFLAGRPWNYDDRKDARILVGLLIEHSMTAEVASQVNTLQRKLWDDVAP